MIMKTAILSICITSILFLQGHSHEPQEIFQSGKTEILTKVINESFSLDHTTPAILKEHGFAPLIGENLDDWKIHNDKPEVKFTLKDGIISGTAEELKGNSFLYTEKEYSDYLLYFEFRFDHLKGNSGLMYHSHYKDADGERIRFAGLQYEMDPGDKKMGDIKRQWTGLLYAEKLNGWVYPNRDGKGAGEKATDEEMTTFSKIGHESLNEEGWNSAFIRIRGDKIETWLNGQLRTNCTLPENLPLTKGSIALQIHGGPSCAASWKNIYLLPLK